MRKVSKFIARSVLVVAVTLALNAPAYARGRDRDDLRQPKTPIVKKILKFFLSDLGDGVILPWP